MSAKVHSEIELYRVDSRTASKLVWDLNNRLFSHAPVARPVGRAVLCPPPAISKLGAHGVTRPTFRRPTGCCLQLDHLRGVNVLARANFIQQLFAWRIVEIQHSERGTAGLISTE